MITETPVRLMRDMLYSAGVNGTRISQAITYLDKIFDERQPIILITEHKVYENVILKGISYEYQTEYAMQFDLEFEQVRLVSYGETNAIALKTKPNKNTGVKTRKVLVQMLIWMQEQGKQLVQNILVITVQMVKNKEKIFGYFILFKDQ